MGSADERDDFTLDEIEGRLGGGHRFPFHEVLSEHVHRCVCEALAQAASVTFGAMGYGVLASVRLSTPDGRFYRVSFHSPSEMNETLRILGSEKGMEWALQRAEKSRPRRR